MLRPFIVLFSSDCGFSFTVLGLTNRQVWLACFDHFVMIYAAHLCQASW